jgi:cytochrome b6-f complex iron-sulfur subunit
MKKYLPQISFDNKSSRRDFLKSSWKVLGLVAAAELVFFTANLLDSDNEESKDKSITNLKVVGNVNDFKINSVNVDRVNKFFLVRDEEGGFLALSLGCSHLGCSVLWDEAKQKFICPCHSSSFDKRGSVLTSPAPRPLDYYRVLIEDGKVKIDFSKKIQRKKFDKTQVAYAI